MSVFVTEYSDVYRMPDGVGFAAEPALATTVNANSSGAAAASITFKNNTRIVRIATDTSSATCFLISTAGTAATTSAGTYVGKSSTEWRSVPNGYILSTIASGT